MKKYCRYCAYCIPGNTCAYYCTNKEQPMHRADREVKCDDFVLSDLGDVDTGKQYKPRGEYRPRKKPVHIEVEQLSLFDERRNDDA